MWARAGRGPQSGQGAAITDVSSQGVEVCLGGGVTPQSCRLQQPLRTQQRILAVAQGGPGMAAPVEDDKNKNKNTVFH